MSTGESFTSFKNPKFPKNPEKPRKSVEEMTVDELHQTCRELGNSSAAKAERKRLRARADELIRIAAGTTRVYRVNIK